MTYREMLDMGEKFLGDADITEARSNAWLLLAMTCRIDRSFYYLHMDGEVLPEQLSEYQSVLKKRAEHIPIQYITGETEFMGLKFKVNSNVLVPRQDTETLVEEVVKSARPGMKILDLCTGSGCIMVSIMHYVPKIFGFAADISRQALNVAKENAKLNETPIHFEQSDLFDNIRGTFDIIVSNPPYIRSADIPGLMPEVGQFEPVEALDGKEDGLYFYRKIIEKSGSHLNPGGRIFFEIGYDQGADVCDLLLHAGYEEVKVVQDLAHLDRVVTGKLAGSCERNE
ncbi:MAG: peptide chain release factor N(5)-glutamine methyltransferase [Lachnospiraceae bacterium]|nr:peptide chain release factor N(5)-glutamine methyltransferase [Lachnospiraceae bacterium]